MTLAQAIARLARTQTRMEAVLRGTAHEMGVACVRTAQRKLGNYQGEVNLVIPGVGGPFERWDPLADETLERKLREGFPTPSPLLRSRDMQNAITYAVEDHLPQSVVVRFQCTEEYARHQEFGTEFMPPRPFMMPAAFEVIDKFRNRLRRRLIDVVL